MLVQKILNHAQQKPRIFGLDVIRTIAIVSVVVAHGAAVLPNLNAASRNVFRYGFGFFGVELFFVLSGFLVGGILLRSVQSVDRYQFTHIIPFWQRRWRRTLPNYYFFFLLAVAHAVFIKHSFSFDVRYLFFLQNVVAPIPNFYDITWSLSIEEWFYLLFPLTLLCALLFFQKSKKNIFGIVCLAWIVGGLILRWLFPNTGEGWDEGVRKIVLWRLDAIPYGVLAAFLVNKKIQFSRLGLIIAALLTTFGAVVLLWQTEISNAQNSPLLFSLTDFSFAIWVFWAAQWRTVSKQNGFTHWITLTSVCAYSMYLIHPWAILLVNKGQEKMGFDYPILAYVAMWGVTYVWSMIQFYYFEKRWL